MNREEILNEIDEAINEMCNVKAKVNQTLSHARNIVARDGDDVAGYNKGLEDGRNEVWELLAEMIDMSAMKAKEIYDYVCLTDVLNNLTPQEALAKLEAYEKEQAEIKVGDVVRIDATHSCGIVIAIDKIQRKARLMYEDTSFRTNEWYLTDLKKTGKHIDIQNILEQIGGDT